MGNAVESEVKYWEIIAERLSRSTPFPRCAQLARLEKHYRFLKYVDQLARHGAPLFHQR